MANSVTHLKSEGITVSDLIRRSYACGEDVLAGNISAEQSAAAARHFGNLAKFMWLKAKYGNVGVDGT